MPLIKVSINKNVGLSRSNAEEKNNKVALTANQSCVNTRKCLRFKISARAPLGTPNKSTGRFAAVCTKAINVDAKKSDEDFGFGRRGRL